MTAARLEVAVLEAAELPSCACSAAGQPRCSPTCTPDTASICAATSRSQPEHRLQPPMPVVARVQWADDGVEYVETTALGWTGRQVYVRMADPRWRFSAVLLDASNVRRR